MSNETVDNSLPNMHDTEDKIFNHCEVEIVEFTEFITKFDDIDGSFHKRFLSDDYKDLNLDNVTLRKNGELIHKEHHSVLTDDGMRRDFQYSVTLHRASGRLVHPFIFNTGEIPKSTMEFACPNSFYNPVFVNTKEIEGSVRLNNIKYKILNNEEINAFDVLDLIWMPKYRWDCEIESIVVELVGIYNQIIVDEHLLNVLRECLILWSGKFVSDKKNIELVIGGLKMSAQEVIDLRKDIVNARIDGMLCRAEKKGMEAGVEVGKLEMARNMLEDGFPIEKVVEISGLSKEDILNSK
jgi:hypothetical protein